MRKSLSLLYASALLLAGCQTDSYEAGQGRYSLMQTDLADVAVDGDKKAVSFTTDDGDQYTFTSAATAQWIQTADTTYRAVVYYNKVASGQAEALGLSAVPTVIPKESWRFKETRQDPVGVESIWLSRSRKYVNMGLLFMSGYVDDVLGRHAISVAQDTILVNADQTRTAYYRFLHDQGDTPQHFTSRHYVSILLPQQLPDTVCLSIVTHSGTVSRRLALRQ